MAKGADCKSAALWLRRFESFLPHHPLSFRMLFAYGISLSARTFPIGAGIDDSTFVHFAHASSGQQHPVRFAYINCGSSSPSTQPKIASSSGPVAPFSAAIVAAILRTPCALFLIPAARAAAENSLPKLSLVNGRPRAPQIHARSPVGPASSVFCRTGKIGSVTVTVSPLFSVRNVATCDMRPSGFLTSLTCCRPIITASPRRGPVYRMTSSHTRWRVPSGYFF